MKRIGAKILVLAIVIQAVCTMGNFSKAASTLHNPTVVNGITTWDCVYFGNYWQNDTNKDGIADQKDKKQPIKWRVLSVNGNNAFLLADQNLDVQPYNTGNDVATWETCTLRGWLNSTFLSAAFSATEQAAIQNTRVVNDDNSYYKTEGGLNTIDKVYLLSIAETGNTAYGFNKEFRAKSETRVATNTPYAAELNSYKSSVAKADWWWLRSPGYDNGNASGVDEYGYGYINGNYISNMRGTVRPVLHLNLSISCWTYAGKVTSKVENVNASQSKTAVPTLTPTNKTENASKGQENAASSQTSNVSNKNSNKKTGQKTKIKVGRVIKKNSLVYKVTKVSGKKGNLKLIRLSSYKLKKVTIPKKIKISGIRFVVTVIGKNVFNTKCKKLKKIVIKSTDLKKIERNKIRRTCKITVPKSKAKKYAKLLKRKY